MNYVSLGYFCSIASELERLGLRNASLPFDWVISDFEGVVSAIECNFEDYLSYEHLQQNKENRAVYKNEKYNISFYHDFSKYKKLSKQLPRVQEKYNRRIARFYDLITKPTLFVRYISDEVCVRGVAKELKYVEENYDYIVDVLKSYNKENDILFIANDGVSSSKFKIYNVTKDKNDLVSRRPVDSNELLFEVLNKEELPDREDNIKRYLLKEKKKKRMFVRMKSKVVSTIKGICLKEYVHEKQY